MKKNNIYKIGTSLVFSLFLMVISFSLVSATGCCERTVDTYSGLPYCASGVESTDCESAAFFHSFQDCSEVSQCQLGTRICKSGCTANVTRLESIDGNCSWNSDRDLKNIDQCKEGCCAIPSGLVCTVQQSIACDELAGDNEPDFKVDIKKDSVCSNYCGQKEWGTCVSDSGCDYTTKEDCISNLGGDVSALIPYENFFKDTAVCKVAECGRICRDELRCGEASFDNRDKICWYDNEGDIDENDCIYDCGGVEHKCVECDEDNCTDSKRTGTTVKNGEPYCSKTSCTVNLKYGGQAWSDSQNKIINLPGGQKTILNTRSICYNFYTDYGDDEVLVSTGLQNSKIVCEYGEAVQQTFGENRTQLCEQAGASGSLVCKCGEDQINDYSNCRSCGDGGRSLFGDIFQIATLPFLNDIIGRENCLIEDCEALGDCVYHKDWTGPTSYIGSCDPKFPIGNANDCEECGEGGDALYNQPTRSECYSLGNCDYKSGKENILKDIIAIGTINLYAERLSWTPIEAGVAAVFAAGCILPGGSAFANTMCGGCVPCLTYGPKQFVTYGIAYPLKAVAWLVGDVLSGSFGEAANIIRGAWQGIF